MPAWTQFIMPGVMLGAGMYVKHKQAQRVKWFLGPEETARSTPFAILLVKIKTGNELPAPPEGFRWRPIRMTVATSPFAPAEELELNVLGQKPALEFPAVPRTPSDQGLRGLGDAAAALGPFLRERGLELVMVDPARAMDGDHVVTSDCKLHVVEGHRLGLRKEMLLREVHPTQDARSVWIEGVSRPLQCAFGVRRSA